MVVRRPHDCPVPFIDLTVEDGEDGIIETSKPDVEKELVVGSSLN